LHKKKKVLTGRRNSDGEMGEYDLLGEAWYLEPCCLIFVGLVWSVKEMPFMNEKKSTTGILCIVWYMNEIG